MKFSTKQQQALEAGKIRRKQLIKAAEKFSQADISMDYPHSYIYSLGGLGKTYNVTKAVSGMGVPFKIVSGKQSDWGFALELAIIYHFKPKGVVFRIIIDDCDSILKPSMINTTKNMLEGTKKLAYTQHIQEHLLDTPQKKEAINKLRKSVGFEVPCDEFIFIFTSNYKLPTSNEALKAEEDGPSNKNQRIIDLNAIRTRCKTKDIIFSDNTEHWGWLADAMLNDGSVSHLINENETKELLIWIWNNWSRLNGRCLRTMNQMAEIMKTEDDYLDTWESDYIDHTTSVNYAGL
jgi:transcriptional regulator of met regulon